MRTLLGIGLVLACGVAAAQDKKDEKIDAKKLLGKWEGTIGKGGKMAVEYKDGGKVSAKVSFGEGKELDVEGTYKLDGNKLTQTMEIGGKEQVRTSTITKLTDTEMEAENEKGVKTTFKRVKAEKKKD
ncbi:MAG: TIGR03066 family protein [Isosphaera sp.]|nr:TIGR03066 family protein [Isosphaera sp.]